MAAQLSDLAKRIRTTASAEKRSLDDYDCFLKQLGLFDAFSKIDLSLGPAKIGLDQVNFFRLGDTNETDKRLKAAFKFCGLSEDQPRHWRALLNTLVKECFPISGRRKTRDEEGLLRVLMDIHEVQAENAQLKGAEEIAKKLLRASKYAKRYSTIKSVEVMTKLVRKAQNPKHNLFARYREEKDINFHVFREQYRALGTSGEAFETNVRPLVEAALAVGNQRSHEDVLVEELKNKHFQTTRTACSWEAEQYYRQKVKAALEKRLNVPKDGSEPSSEL